MEGIVRGNVFANDVKIKNAGMLLGDVQCMCLTLDPTASIRVSNNRNVRNPRTQPPFLPPPPRF